MAKEFNYSIPDPSLDKMATPLTVGNMKIEAYIPGETQHGCQSIIYYLVI
ncbi:MULTISPECIES: hypothetical protein [Bacillales]|nr:hypothetical protein [Brevibacillus sp. JNUCC-41]QOS89214.1 hypothetical protein JNUCC41_20995 [Brevibacillus sp. JNUCC-41]